MKKIFGHRGFSLIELMVVIAIIGILIGLVYVNFAESRLETQDELKKTELLELQLAIEQFKAQTGRYPAGCAPAMTVPSGGVNRSWSTHNDLGGQDAIWWQLNDSDADHQCSNYIQGLVPDFIESLPTTLGIFYRTNSEQTAYKLIQYRNVEVNRLTSRIEPFSACPSHCGPQITFSSSVDLTNFLCVGGSAQNRNTWDRSYAVASPGAECWGAHE
jgi:prepilin-type N-terminal cleavage/methylation domain-containing protein